LWAMPYLMEAYGQSQQQAGNALSLWAVGLIVGCTLWGYVADNLLGSRKAVVLAGAAVYGLLWLLLALVPAGLPAWMLWLAMLWGGFFASTWIPAYALLKDSLPRQVVATAMGILNLFFWLGGAVFQQASGLILALFPKTAGVTPASGYQALFWVAFAAVAASAALVACAREPAHPAASRMARKPSR
jgi:MFS family permease